MKLTHTVATFAATLITIGSLAGGANAATLTTTFAGGNGQNGNMFDVNIISTTDLLVTSLDLNMNMDMSVETSDIEVYGRIGSWVSFEGSSAGWTLLSQTPSVTGNGEGLSTTVNINDFVLPALSTYALYITRTTGDLNYTNGTSVGNVFAQNADLQILEGAGKVYAFSNTFTPRIWNGSITYNTVIPEPTSALLLSLSAIGIVARRRQIR